LYDPLMALTMRERAFRPALITPRLPDERVVEPAEIDLDRWRLDLQVLAQTAERHPRSSCWPARHRAGTLPRGPDAHEPSTTGRRSGSIRMYKALSGKGQIHFSRPDHHHLSLRASR
jgi:hypothetical protein